MPRTRTYDSLLTQIERLQAEAEEIRNRDRNKAIDSVLTTMERFGLTIDDLKGATGGGRRRAATADVAADAPRKRGRPAGAAKKAKPASRGKAVKKPEFRFLDPATGNGWTGRGRAPRWLTEAEAAGRKREEFAVGEKSEPKAA